MKMNNQMNWKGEWNRDWNGNWEGGSNLDQNYVCGFGLGSRLRLVL